MTAKKSSLLFMTLGLLACDMTDIDEATIGDGIDDEVTLAIADSAQSAQVSFGGYNIYAPTLLMDGSRYKMWYGGWQSSSTRRDTIYYRSSSDGKQWGAPRSVVTTSQIGPYEHVNDPSIVKKGSTYVMFFTACKINCDHRGDNEIWSATSTNGVNWRSFKRVMAGSPGPAEPAVYSRSGGYYLYYVDRLAQNRVVRATLDSNRNAIKVDVVYESVGLPSGSSLANPEVKRFNNKYHLFVNVNTGPTFSIYKAESRSLAQWTGMKPLLYGVEGSYSNNPQAGSCGKTAPGVLPVSSSSANYNLYFGESFTVDTNNRCNLARHQHIAHWAFTD